MGYRIGNFYYKQSDDWRGYNVFEDGSDDGYYGHIVDTQAANEDKAVVLIQDGYGWQDAHGMA